MKNGYNYDDVNKNGYSWPTWNKDILKVYDVTIPAYYVINKIL